VKVLLYAGSLKLVEKSGVGQAIFHQKAALDSEGIPCTMDSKDYHDIVHINTIFPNSFFKAIMERLRGKKVVYYAHSTQEDFRNSFKGSNLFAPIFKWWIKRCYNLGHVLITPTEYSKSLLTGYGIKKKIVPLSNGIDLSIYKKDDEGGRRFRHRYGFSVWDKVIISVGHYINRKGIKDFVALAKAMPEYKFIWFGYSAPALCTPDVNDCLKSIPSNLLLPGLASQEELRDAYSGSDLFLFMTYEETEGIVLLEALAMKLQVLIRDIPIYQKDFIHGENCYKATDNYEFQSLISQIFEGNLPSTVTEGYETVKKRDIPAIGTELKKIYSDLLQ